MMGYRFRRMVLDHRGADGRPPILRGRSSAIEARPESSGPEAGFTLVEVIVSLAIFALAASVLMPVVSSGMRQLGQADAVTQAGTLAQSLLAKVGIEVPLDAGETFGHFDDRFRWRLKIEPFADGADPWPLTAYRVSAVVQWTDGPASRSFGLTTLRLGPKASSP